ncbi:MAG: biopolymer transporter ExbD [Spongiibacteraceae bacterium]
MAMRRVRAHQEEAADLDMTPFISLLVALVPFLLVSVVFSHITVLDLKLPNAAGGEGGASESQNEEVELVIRADHLDINYPRGTLVKSIADVDGKHDYAMLSSVLQEVKRQLKEKSIEKKTITILSEADTPYQTIVSSMDTVRSYKTTLVTSVVDAELFPDISFGDAPAVNTNTAAGATP